MLTKPVFGYKNFILHENLLFSIMQILDERLPLAGKKIIAGEINTFNELLKFVPKTVLAKALSLNTSKWFVNKFEDPYFFRVGEMIELAKLLDIESCQLLEIMVPVIVSIKDRKFTARPKPKDTETAKDRAQAKQLKAQGMKNKDITDLMEISRMTLYRYLHEDDQQKSDKT